MTVKTPPYVQLSWTATALGTAFGGYNVYRRPSRMPVFPWVQIGKITVPSGYTAATVEAQHNGFNDYETGWALAGGQWADGFDYAVTVVNATTGVESAYTTITNVAAQFGTPIRDNNPWVVSNQAPFYNFPIASLQGLSTSDDPSRTVWRIAGRDTAVARTRLELPPRNVALQSRVFSRVGEDPARTYRAAAASGLTVCLLDPLGDRYFGVLEAPSGLPHEAEGTWTLSGELVETARDTAVVADYNQPAALVFAAASTQYVSIADAANAMSPGTGAFSVCYFGTLNNINTNKTYFGKGTNPAHTATNGWALGSINTSNVFEFAVTGTSSVLAQLTPTALYGDGKRHSFVGIYSPTGGATLTIDGSGGVLNPATVGTVTATGIVTAAADPGLTAGFFPDTVGTAWGYWPRALSTAEVANLDAYLRGNFGARLPAGATMFMDLRNAACWDGTQATNLADLAGNGFVGAFVNAPKTKGIPWDVSPIDRF
jgi:hypothetical protein